MTRGNGKISTDDLHAYADGRLDEGRRQMVENYLDSHPDSKADVAAWKRQNQAIRALYDHIIDEPVPEHLNPSQMLLRQRRFMFEWRSIAAALVLLFGGGALGWLSRGYEPAAMSPSIVTFVDPAIAAHADYTFASKHGVEISLNEKTHLVGLLSQRLGLKMTAPDLTNNGFQLVGGRLLAASQGPAAQFIYENSKGRRISLYATRSPSVQLPSFQFRAGNNYQSFNWQDQKLSYAIVGDLERAELKNQALQIYLQLSRLPASKEEPDTPANDAQDEAVKKVTADNAQDETIKKPAIDNAQNGNIKKIAIDQAKISPGAKMDNELESNLDQNSSPTQNTEN